MTPRGSTPTNQTAILALVLSILGITSPIGLYLAYRSLDTISRTKELGAPYAVAAKWIGWIYMVVIVLVILAYLWIIVTGS